ncbi:MAG TPA: hypothetical protein VE913_07105, partial [Longimicrobium sp.]|nr:hypothetical protein [Longimicrobium sp.]
MFRSDHLLVQPIWEHRAAYYDLARERGFGVEIVSFALVPIVNDPAAAAEHLRGYEAEVALSIPRTLHGPFVDVIPHSPDRLVAEVARRRVAECLEIAAK